MNDYVPKLNIQNSLLGWTLFSWMYDSLRKLSSKLFLDIFCTSPAICVKPHILFDQKRLIYLEGRWKIRKYVLICVQYLPAGLKSFCSGEDQSGPELE